MLASSSVIFPRPGRVPSSPAREDNRWDGRRPGGRFDRRAGTCGSARAERPRGYARALDSRRKGAVVANVEAHITGTVWKVEVEVGDTVEEGDTVVILESMKMEMPVRS